MVVKLKVIHHGRKLTDNLKETKYWPKYSSFRPTPHTHTTAPVLQYCPFSLEIQIPLSEDVVYNHFLKKVFRFHDTILRWARIPRIFLGTKTSGPRHAFQKWVPWSVGLASIIAPTLETGLFKTSFSSRSWCTFRHKETAPRKRIVINGVVIKPLKRYMFNHFHLQIHVPLGCPRKLVIKWLVNGL